MANRLYQEGASLINYACSEPKVEKCGTQALYLIIFFLTLFHISKQMNCIITTKLRARITLLECNPGFISIQRHWGDWGRHKFCTVFKV